VIVSAALRLALAKQSPAPWIFGDELIYANLAQSFAESGHFAVRESAGLHGYGPGYPMLIAPAYAIFGDLAHAYAAAKAINAVLMSLAAVPVYLIARRLVSVPLALLASALALAIPSLIYTGTIMTENAFYAAFLVCILGLLSALERPTLWRQLGALALVLGAFLIRAQAVTLFLAFITAIVLVSLVEARVAGRLTRRELTRRLLEFRVTWIALGSGLALAVAAELARGRSPAQLLGGYRGLVESGYGVGSVARWMLFHAAELDLYVGILPFAALIALAIQSLTRAELPRPLRLFGLLALSLAVWMTFVVGATASFFAADGSGRIEERALFHVAPLCLIALLVWVESGRLRIWPVAAVAALVAGALPGAIPYNEFANLTALSDTLVMIPLWNLVYFHHIEAGSLAPLVTAASLAAALVFLLLPRRLALLAPALVVGWFVLITVSLQHQISGTSSGVLQQGLSVRREWIDEAVGRHAQVAALWTGNASPMTVIQNGFFNRSVHPIYDVGGVPPASGLVPTKRAMLEETTGLLRGDDGRPVRAQYALADRSLALAGREIARDPGAGMVLYRVDGPVRVRGRLTGVYSDSWTGPQAEYTRWACRGGRLLVMFASQPGLFKKAQTVVAVANGRAVGRVRVAPTADERSATLPLASRRGRCSIQLVVSRTVVPSEILGTPDTRELGVRITALDYLPPS
jgi:4-amino-4-deoxy-L-arabinose transferase-like glycosyltransferase